MLRYHNVFSHPCFTRGFDAACGIAPFHPATSAVVWYNFTDAATELEGHSIHSSLGGLCVDDACVDVITVALHPARQSKGSGETFLSGEANCSFQALPDSSLASVAGALVQVAEVDKERLASRAIDLGNVRYGVVTRHHQQLWNAIGYRNVRSLYCESLPGATSLRFSGCCGWSRLGSAVPQRRQRAFLRAVRGKHSGQREQLSPDHKDMYFLTVSI